MCVKLISVLQNGEIKIVSFVKFHNVLNYALCVYNLYIRYSEMR